jgi:hypothetical protein
MQLEEQTIYSSHTLISKVFICSIYIYIYILFLKLYLGGNAHKTPRLSPTNVVLLPVALVPYY